MRKVVLFQNLSQRCRANEKETVFHADKRLRVKKE